MNTKYMPYDYALELFQESFDMDEDSPAFSYAFEVWQGEHDIIVED